MKLNPSLFSYCKMLIWLSLASVLCWGNPVAAQTTWPYSLQTGKEVALLGGGLLTNGVGLFQIQRVEPLTPLEIAALDRNDINAFDRPATTYSSHSAQIASDFAPLIAGIGSASLLMDKEIRKNHFGELCVMGIEGGLLTLGVNQSIKATLLRERPYLYNPSVSWNEKGKKDARFSLYSQHTSLTGYLSFFAAKIYHDTHPNAKNRWLVWAGAGALTSATGFLRVRAGKHFPTDVIVGGAMGALAGWGIPQLHLSKEGSIGVVPVVGDGMVGVNVQF